MPRPPLVALGMEAQVAVSECRASCKALYTDGLASGDFDLMLEVQAFASTLRIAQMQARRLTARAEQLTAGVDQPTLFERGIA